MRIAGILAALAGALIIAAPAGAVPIHVHKKVPVKKEVIEHELVRGDPIGPIEDTVIVQRTVVDVVHVAPVDEDDDGIADAKDDCVFCPPPEPEVAYVEETYSPSGVVEETTYAPTGVSNSTVMCESGGDYAANTGNGYYGGYQFDSGTWDAYGDPAYGEANEAPPAVQDAAAASVPYDAWPNC